MFGEPVTVTRARDHEFKSRTPRKLLEKGQHDLCLHCMRGKHNPIHHAFPESTRVWGSGNRKAYQGANDDWYKVFSAMLKKSDLETNLVRVGVEAEYVIGKKMTIDQDNFRYPCSKFLGDTMVKDGYISDDKLDWETGLWLFSFGELYVRYEKDIWQMNLTIMPTYRSGSGSDYAPA